MGRICVSYPNPVPRFTLPIECLFSLQPDFLFLGICYSSRASSFWELMMDGQASLYLGDFLPLPTGPWLVYGEGVGWHIQNQGLLRPQSDSCPHCHGEHSPSNLGG